MEMMDRVKDSIDQVDEKQTKTPAIGKGDLVIAISGSGKTKLAISDAEISDEVGAKVVAMTSFPENHLGRAADHVVKIRGRTQPRKNATISLARLLGSMNPLPPWSDY